MVRVLPAQLAAVVHRVPAKEGVRLPWIPVHPGRSIVHAGRLALAEQIPANPPSRARSVRERIKRQIGNDSGVHANGGPPRQYPPAGILVGNQSVLGDSQSFPEPLIIAEEEEAVADDRSAGRRAELVALE